MWEQLSSIYNQLWIWLSYEVGSHPFLFLSIAVVIVSAWILYMAEVRAR
jgi:hypothetical protein